MIENVEYKFNTPPYEPFIWSITLKVNLFKMRKNSVFKSDQNGK